VGTRIDACVAECQALSARGEQLAQAAAGVSVAEVKGRARAATEDAAAHPADASRLALAEALASETRSAEQLHASVSGAELHLRRLVAQLNDAVNRAVEAAFTGASERSFTSLIDELEAVRWGLRDARAAAGDVG
jgi:hypothetical protein